MAVKRQFIPLRASVVPIASAFRSDGSFFLFPSGPAVYFVCYQFPMVAVSLDYLPTELYDAILSHVHPAERQDTTLALSLAIPKSPVPIDHLFRHVHVHQRSQVPKLWRRLTINAAGEKHLREPHWVQSFQLEGWDPDADVAIKSAII